LEVIPERKQNKDLMDRVDYIKGTGKGLNLHMANFIEGVKSHNQNLNANITVAANTARVAHLGNIAHRTGKRLYWDTENSIFVDDSDANEYLTPTYRAPWKLPKI
jgi:hypothetical protein